MRFLDVSSNWFEMAPRAVVLRWFRRVLLTCRSGVWLMMVMATSRRSCAMLLESHDFIHLKNCNPQSYTPKAVKLYKMGLSLREVEDRLGLSKTKIRDLLIEAGIPLRPMRDEPGRGTSGTRGKGNAKPPYGFCYFEGRISRHPKEYPTLLNIISRWKSGQSANSISTWLNGKGVASPMNRSWSWNSVTNIIERVNSGRLIQKGDHYEFR
jgi:hypothetical protein